VRGRNSATHFLPLTSYFSLLLLLRIPGRERHPIGELPIQTDLEGVLSGAGKGHVENEYGTGLHIDHAGGRLTELYGAFASQKLTPALVHEADPDGVGADLGATAPNPKDQVGPRVYRREVRQPDMLEHAEHAELTLLIDEGVVRNDGEIEMQLRRPV
jgi:hypothetical protein